MTCYDEVIPIDLECCGTCRYHDEPFMPYSGRVPCLITGDLTKDGDLCEFWRSRVESRKGKVNGNK